MKVLYKFKFNSRLFFLVASVLVFLSYSSFAFSHGMSEADKLAIIEGGNLSFLWLGMTHMLSGYDHLLFVFGIIFFLTTFRDIAKYVTAFTLGHSVTLIFATFNAITLNYFIIDAVIGLSVCYIAFSNIDGFRKYLNIKSPNMLFMIIALGLIHGFGLSTRLQELPLSEEQLLFNIISFNVGIELGQIAALAFMLILISAWRKSSVFQTFSLVANYLLIIAGSLLFLMQMHGYSHSSDTEQLAETELESQNENSKTNKSSPTIEARPAKTGWNDIFTIIIPARGEKEYKLVLAKNTRLEYFWKTDGENLFYDFHGEPAGDTTGYFESFKKNTESQSTGSYTTSFAGNHGWYWKNNSNTAVVITLKTKGEYKLLEK